MVSSQHSYDPSDARTRVALLTEQNAKSLWLEQKKQEIREKNAGDAGAAAAQLQALQNGVNGGGGGRGGRGRGGADSIVEERVRAGDEDDNTWYLYLPGLVGAGTALLVVGFLSFSSWRKGQGS